MAECGAGDALVRFARPDAVVSDMAMHAVLAASAVVQILAAVLALRLARAAGRWLAWGLFAGAVGLLAIRSLVLLVQPLSGWPGAAHAGWVTELGALVVSGAMLGALVTLRSPHGALGRSPGLALREREFRSLIDRVSDLIVALDADGTILYASPSIARIVGYDPDAVVGESIFPPIHPDDVDRVRAFFMEYRDVPGLAPPIELRFRHRAGTWRHLEVSANNLLEDSSVGAIVITARDVTDRRRAEREVARLEERLRTVIGNAPVVLFGLDAEGVFTLSEGKGLASLGLESGEVVGQSAYEVYRDVPKITANVRRALAGEEFRDLVEVGELVFDVWYAPVRDEAERVTGAVGVATEVTDRERTWEALQESEQVYRALVEQSPDPISIVQDEDLVLVNHAWEELFGYARRDVAVKRFAFQELVAPEARQEVVERLRRRAAGLNVPSRYELVGLSRDGRRIYLEASEAEIVWRGRPAVQGLYHDVTAHRQAEEALRRSEADYRALVEHATYGIYRSTPDGRFAAVNPALVRMLGYDSAEELMATRLAADIYVDADTRARLVRQYADAERIEDLEVDWKRKDGSTVRVRLGGRPIRGVDGEIESYEMIVEDVTDRRILEEQLRRAQKMEAIGQLTGGIAHDFNNLLTVILANADIIERGLTPDTAYLKEDLDDLRRAGRRGSDMVRKLLGYSRRGMLTLGPVNLSDQITELLPTLRRVLPENIEVQFASHTTESVVQADDGAMEQILFNLATNARDAMPEGGALRIEVGREAVDEGSSALREWGAWGEYVRVSVSDTGQGMDAATLNRVFDPFFTTKPPGVGTGLGMAMVYGLVKQQGGFIDVRSAPGKGTVYDLYFPPVVPRLGGEGEELDAAGVRGGSETILLVEDEPAIRRSAQRLLEKKGYRVLLAADGAEALETFSAHHKEIDLVISDVVMPRLGGRQLYDSLQRGEKPVRFLFTSGYAARDIRSSGSIDPRLPFLAKPWDVEQLLHRVRELLDAD